MEKEYKDEMKIIGHGAPISFKRLEELKEKSENSTCKINYLGILGTGFFFKYNKDKYYFMTNNHVLDSNAINNNELSIIYKNKEEIIKLNGDRLKLTNKAVPVNEIIKDKNLTIKLVIIWNKDIEFKQIKIIFKSFVKLIFSE